MEPDQALRRQVLANADFLDPSSGWQCENETKSAGNREDLANLGIEQAAV
jgi:hypothetical protein